ncbi:MAG: NUDIX domain-containing protein [Alphaproteobacteria bacterium]|nr:NUDIX domain-containing protein [Alphaproteobacteria bacterium]
MTEDDFEILSQDTGYDGYFRIDRYRLRHKLFAGGWSPVLDRELFERGHVVAVLPYDPVRDEVVLIEQFRIGAYSGGMGPWITEIVAGVIDADEDPDDVAHRETREETGLPLTELIPVYHYLSSPGGTSESVRLYCGRVDASDAGGLHGHADEGEDIRVFALPFAEIKARLAHGGFDNGMTIIGLQWLALNRADLRRRWLPSRTR